MLPPTALSPSEHEALVALRAFGPQRVLVVHEHPPKFDLQGCDVRIQQLMDLWQAAGFEVTFLSRMADFDPSGKYTRYLRDRGFRVFGPDPERAPLLDHAKGPPLNLQALLADNFDVVVLFQWYWFGTSVVEAYLDAIRRWAPRSKVVVLSDDVHWLREERRAGISKSCLEAERVESMKTREYAAYRNADLVVAITDLDEERFRKDLPEIKPVIVHYGRGPVPDAVAGFHQRKGLLFVGNGQNTANSSGVRWFVKEVWPLVRARLPDVVLDVVGLPPLDGPWNFAVGSGIRAVGPVENLDVVLSAARVFVSPIPFGTGLKTKNVEALVAGIPLVTTSIGAEGMSLNDRQSRVRDDAASFADAVVELYTEPKVWGEVSVNALEHARAHFGREKVIADLVGLQEALAGVTPKGMAVWPSTFNRSSFERRRRIQVELQDGVAALETGRIAGALAIFRDTALSFAGYPDDAPEALNLYGALALTYAIGGNRAASEQFARAALKMDPWYATAYQALRELGIHEEAPARPRRIGRGQDLWDAPLDKKEELILAFAPHHGGPPDRAAWLSWFRALGQWPEFARNVTLRAAQPEQWAPWARQAGVVVNALRGEVTVEEIKPRVLYVMEWYILQPCGATTVAENQLRWLTEQGFQVDLLVTSYPEADVDAISFEVEWELRRKLLQYSVGKVWIVGLQGYATYRDSRDALRWRHWQARRAAGEKNLQFELDGHALMRLPEGLHAEVEAKAYAFALVNYVFNVPFIERLGGLPIVLETHDLMSYTNAYQRGTPLDALEWKRETELFAKCASLVVINSDEKDKVKAVLPARPVVHALPPSGTEGVETTLAGCVNLAEVLAAAGPSPQAMERCSARLARAESLDVLVVSSPYVPNVRSFNRFFREVFRPHLAPLGVNLWLAGAIGDSPELERNLGDSVFVLGKVRDLRPLYAAARLVVAPVDGGAGTAIKTLEAFTARKPLVGTPFAFRGIGLESEALVDFVADSNEEAARRVQQLLHSPAARREAQHKSARIAGRFAARAVHSQRFAEAVRAGMPTFAYRATDVVAGEPCPALLEWGAVIAGFNRSLRAYGSAILTWNADTLRVQQLALDPAWRAWFTQLATAYLDGTAPVRQGIAAGHFFINLADPSAEGFFLALDKIDPGRTALLAAGVALRAHQWEEALGLAFSVLEQSDLRVDAWRLVAEIFRGAGDTDKARQSLENAELVWTSLLA